MLPFGYEPQLLEKQMRYGQSLFACDSYAVYSNRSWIFGSGESARVVNVSMQCEIGGEFKTALNTKIFRAVWQQVVSDGTYQGYDWTVKVDPDCVFFPERLRTLVQGHNALASPNGVYLNNCRFGMHGPVEVFSKAAVALLVQGWQECEDAFRIKCSGDCAWGEDMFVDQCLSKVLKARREEEYSLLSEDHCDPPEGWDDCSDTAKAAFHPFKQWDRYKGCLLNSMPGSTDIMVDGADPDIEDGQRDAAYISSSSRGGYRYEAAQEGATEYFK